MSMCSAIKNDLEASRIGKVNAVQMIGKKLCISNNEIEKLIANDKFIDSLQEDEAYITESLMDLYGNQS